MRCPCAVLPLFAGRRHNRTRPGMEHGLRLPWWEFRPTDFALPGSVVPPDSGAEEGLLASFLRASSRAETADGFVSANSLNVIGVLDALSREELVLPMPHETAANPHAWEPPQLGCRSRLLGMPLADRHAVLAVACSLRHRLPRRALVNFLCRLVLGKDVGCLPSSEVDSCYRKNQNLSDEVIPGACRHRGGKGSCACGGQTSSARDTRRAPELAGGSTGTRSRGSVSLDGVAATPRAAASAASAACRSCLARRAWLDLGSARLLIVACHKLLWDKFLPEDEKRSLDRCLCALSEVLGEGAQNPRPNSQDPEGAARSSCVLLPSPVIPAGRVGVSALLAAASRRRIEATRPTTNVVAHHAQNQRKRAEPGAEPAAEPGEKGTQAAVGRKRRSIREGEDAKGSQGLSGSGSAPPPARDCGTPESRNTAGRLETRGRGSGDAIGRGAEVVTVDQDAEAPSSSDPATRGGGSESTGEDYLPSAIRQRMASVAEKVAAAGARGAASTEVQIAAAATVSLLHEAMKLPSTATSSINNTRAGGGSSNYFSNQPHQHQQQPQQPLEAVCSGLGLDVSRGKGAPVAPATAGGCGDDLVMAVCDGFVTPALSLKNCLAFVKAVLVPRARALTTPASRLLVTTVAGIGKARPEVVIDGLLRPLLCEGDPATVGSAQCELCTRLIKQVLPKHVLEAVLVGLCDPAPENDQAAGGWGEGLKGSGGGGGSASKSGPRKEAGSHCVWTELTIPVITTALNLKPGLSDKAIAVLVRGVEVAAEQPNLQKSLKFTTFIHSLVTRYGPQLKPHVPMLRAAVGRCSTFMVKAVLAALQRLEK